MLVNLAELKGAAEAAQELIKNKAADALGYYRGLADGVSLIVKEVEKISGPPPENSQPSSDAGTPEPKKAKASRKPGRKAVG